VCLLALLVVAAAVDMQTAHPLRELKQKLSLLETTTRSPCSAKKGTCGPASACTAGTTKSGLCPGKASVVCCLPKSTSQAKPTGGSTAPVPKKPTGSTSPSKPTGGSAAPAPTTAPAGGATSGDCGAYANLPLTPKTGNRNVQYQTVPIQKTDLSEPNHFGWADNLADNTMVKTTACVFAQMAKAAAATGIKLTIDSGFRTFARQQYFWNCYQTKKCNGGNLAAKPGNSNHGTGIALDLNTACGGQKNGAKTPAACKSSKVYMWLLSNAANFGFVRAVNKEPWHWELHPGQKQPAFAQFA